MLSAISQHFSGDEMCLLSGLFTWCTRHHFCHIHKRCLPCIGSMIIVTELAAIIVCIVKEFSCTTVLCVNIIFHSFLILLSTCLPSALLTNLIHGLCYFFLQIMNQILDYICSTNFLISLSQAMLIILSGKSCYA